jgi:hypothetical protein
VVFGTRGDERSRFHRFNSPTLLLAAGCPTSGEMRQEQQALLRLIGMLVNMPLMPRYPVVQEELAMRQFRGRRLFNSLTMLAMESHHVVGLRMMKLMRGGRSARREAKLMISEKIQAAAKAGASLIAGASADEMVRQYRRRVLANAKRLGKARRRRRRK